jgi:Rrf2 family protein
MFSNSTKYAIRSIVYMLNAGANQKHTVVDMANDLEIPQPFLSKIMQQLSRSGIISSSKGRGGGFYLSEDNMERPLIDVIIAIEGHNIFKKCVLGLTTCSDENPCLLHNQFGAFRDSISQSVCKDSIRELLIDLKS